MWQAVSAAARRLLAHAGEEEGFRQKPENGWWL
jgi:hypothetical protein